MRGGKMVTKICEQCGESFEAKRKDAKFCSQKCQKRAKRGNSEIVKCVICGTSFPKSGKNIYCCDECKEVARIDDDMNAKFTNRKFDADYDSENYDEDFGLEYDYGDD